jgi:hypothetical protein
MKPEVSCSKEFVVPFDFLGLGVDWVFSFCLRANLEPRSPTHSHCTSATQVADPSIDYLSSPQPSIHPAHPSIHPSKGYIHPFTQGEYYQYY